MLKATDFCLLENSVIIVAILATTIAGAKGRWCCCSLEGA
jgi:hypothetical protein